MQEERVLEGQVLLVVETLAYDWLLWVQGETKRLATEIGNERYSSIDVIANGFKQFGSLGLNNLGLLFVTCV